jgi:hypothetical protein
MKKVRVVYFHIQSSEGGSSRLCQLKTDRLAPVNKIDYVITHIGFIRSGKLSGFDHQVGRYITSLHRCTMG